MIIKELAEGFEGKFECLVENTEKYINFSVPIDKEHKNDKKMAYKTKFIDSIRFMAISLSKLADKLAKDLHNSKCKDQKPCLEYVKI